MDAFGAIGIGGKMQNHLPSISETAFECPHCGAYTSQVWYDLYSESLQDNNSVPMFPKENAFNAVFNDETMAEDQKLELYELIDGINSKNIKFQKKMYEKYLNKYVINLHISECFNCRNVAIWVHDRLIYPVNRVNIQPNIDLPEDIQIDFKEATEIVYYSPRGAAALLRLCIQKLCKYLGEKGKSIDEDIGNLVKKGLNPIVQQSLDIVRVVGNEAVHPGIMDIKDDINTCMTLLEIVNSIAEQMISHPKAIKNLYNKLPEDKRKAIEIRDKNK
jgi:hypothetical protein